MHRRSCQICFDSSVNAIGLYFGNKALLTKTVKHWIPVRLFFECSTEATFALQTDSDPASVGASMYNIYHGSLCYYVVWYTTQVIVFASYLKR